MLALGIGELDVVAGFERCASSHRLLNSDVSALSTSAAASTP